MASNFVTGLDIGTAFIKAGVAENRNSHPILKSVFKVPSAGLRRGAIVDLGEASQAIGRAVMRIRKVGKAAAKNIYVNIGTPQTKTQASKGIVAVSRADTEIYHDDIDRAVKASQAVNLGPNRTIIHNITREYIVDGVGDITDPLGLSGSRLEVSSLIVDAFSPHIKILMKAVEIAGGEVSGLVFGPLVASRAALSRDQKDLGTILIDIGAGTTGMSVYEENKLIHVGKFPVGAGHISSDLAIGLKIPVSVAENLKLNCGCALAREVGHKETIDLSKFYPDARGAVSRRFVAEIIESRLAEILDFVNNELKSLGKHSRLPGGAVVVGGGAKMPGIAELVKQELKLSSQIGFALGDELTAEGLASRDCLEDPEFVVALGLVLWGVDEERWREGNSFSNFKIKNVFKYFLP